MPNTPKCGHAFSTMDVINLTIFKLYIMNRKQCSLLEDILKLLVICMYEYSFCAYAYTCKFFLNSACLERLYLLCKIDLGVLSSFIKIIRMIRFSRFLYSSLLKEKSLVLSGLRLFRLFLLETNPKFDPSPGEFRYSHLQEFRRGLQQI